MIHSKRGEDPLLVSCGEFNRVNSVFFYMLWATEPVISGWDQNIPA